MNDAAMATFVGLDGMRMFKSSDPSEIMLMQVITERTTSFSHAAWKNRATLIANAVGRLFKRG